VAHDFNNLLNIIAAHVELVGRADEPEKQKKSLEAIQKTLQRGSGVVKQLLTFARREKTSFELVQLNAVVEEIVAIVRETFPKSLHIETQLATDLPSILADAGQLHQALLNLLVNARDAMPKGGLITIATSVAASSSVRAAGPEASSETFVELCVQDAGKGMDDATKRKLFEPFFTTKSDAGGQGLGLAVVATIVESHRALIDVESELGRGTRFRIFFPAAESAEVRRAPSRTEGRTGGSDSAAPGASAEHAALSEANGNGQTILLVEDEDLLREAVGALLESEGYRVLSARDGVEAVESHAAHRSEIAAVILDLELP
jgi:signal transduction histidine kinase